MAKQIVDKSSIIIPDGTMEDFSRPNHNDFATTAELKEREFTGFRHNSITEACEIWLLGRCEASVSPEMVEINPHAIDDAYAEVFSLGEVRPFNQALINYKAKKGVYDA